MTDSPFETTLTRRLHDLAEFAVADPSAELGVRTGTVETISPPSRSHRALVVGVAAALIALVTGVALLAGGDGPATHVVVPATEPVVNTLTITTHNFAFDATEYHVPPGLNEIRFVATEGSHQLKFQERDLASVRLLATSRSTTSDGSETVPDRIGVAKVEMKPGHRYTIFCDLPGHRPAGEKATIVVDATASTTSTP